MNRIYLAFPELGFTPSCIVSINDLVIEQCGGTTGAQNAHVLLLARAQMAEAGCRHALYLHHLHRTGFSTDVTGRVWEGATVTYVALQLAYHLGFSKVILIGVDHNFATKGKPNTTVTSRATIPIIFPAPTLARASAGSCRTWRPPSAATASRARPTKPPDARWWMPPSAAN